MNTPLGFSELSIAGALRQRPGELVKCVSVNEHAIVPPMLTYYDHPASLADCTRHTASCILAQFGLDGAGIKDVLVLSNELLAEALHHLAI